MFYSFSSKQILTSLSDGVLRIQFNRPEKKNAITAEMYQCMAEAISQGDKDEAVRVILLTGGTENFTTGNDLALFKLPESPAAEYLFPALLQAQKPVIAAVNGLAVGIGVTMLLHCDLVYAGHEARFRMPFVSLGLCPEFGSSLILSKMMGHQRASELLLLGDFFDAVKACDLGIVSAVFPGGELQEIVFNIACQLAAQPAASVRLTKSLLKQTSETVLKEVIKTELLHFRACKKSPEAAEALAAFAERRKPNFSVFK